MDKMIKNTWRYKSKNFQKVTSFFKSIIYSDIIQDK